MKIVKLKGGLGNQMFQYAYAMLLKTRTKEEVYLDYSAYKSLKNDHVRVPRITKFKISLSPAKDSQIMEVCKLKHEGNSQSLRYKVGIYLEKKLNKEYFFEPNRAYIDPQNIIDKSYYDGYWQSWRYVDEVKKQIDNEFIPNYQLSQRTVETREAIQKENAIFVGVRRGDYEEEASHYGTFGSAYYEQAMAYMDARVENPVYYIFSNDIEWCKKNIVWGDQL